MKLTSMTVKDFCELLSSDAPAPGGGSSSALSGALGAALTEMVSALSLGRDKYKEHEGLNRDIIMESSKLRLQLIDVIDRDTEAFNKVSAVFVMPKNTDKEKEARKQAMQAALKACTLPPFEMMECSFEVLKLLEKALGRTNTNALSDLAVAGLSLKTAIQGAWLNIIANIGAIKDEAFASEYRKKGTDILAEAVPLADKIYETALSNLKTNA